MRAPASALAIRRERAGKDVSECHCGAVWATVMAFAATHHSANALLRGARSVICPVISRLQHRAGCRRPGM